jgi:hypothetical protein
MKPLNRFAWWGAIAIAVIMLVTLLAAPQTLINHGSTYNRSPSGYGAWYAFMQAKGVNIQRWQKPLDDIFSQKTPVTFIQVNSALKAPFLSSEKKEWLEKGNTLVELGIKEPASGAEFSSNLATPVGDVKINTTRRHLMLNQPQENLILGDRFGAILWQENYGKGKVIFATTSNLAANAYQDTANFEYLANLVTKNQQQIFVDEYIHGYKDQSTRAKEGKDSLLSYFTKTPLFPALIQVGVLLLVLIWAENQRFGKPVTLQTPVIDNSQAYIQALAGVLQKAEASDFVVEMLGKQEQIQLQKALGLGNTPVEPSILLTVWAEKTGLSADELNSLLASQNKKYRINEQQLLTWLQKWQNIRKVNQ